MVKAVKFKIEDPDEHFVISSATFSPIGVGTILERLDTYIEETKASSEKMSMIDSDSGDLQSLYNISTIRDRSVEMLAGIELMKASLDRFVCADEDTSHSKRRMVMRRGLIRGRWRRILHVGKRGEKASTTRCKS